MAKNKNLETNLMRVFRREITFTQFAGNTRKEFESLANYLARRWSPPSWFSIDDLVQELCLGAWLHISKWNSARCASIARFVVFNAVAYAKRLLHKARGAKLSGSSDRNPSRIEWPLSSFGEDGAGEEMAEAILAIDAIAEEQLIKAEESMERLRTILDACETRMETHAITVIAQTRDADEAGDVFYDDLDLRFGLRLASEKHAKNYVVNTAARVLVRIQDPSVC